MLNFFFYNPGCFYWFGHPRKAEDEKFFKPSDEKKLYDYFSDVTNLYKNPPVKPFSRVSWPTEFGADLFFRHYLTLADNSLELMKAKGLVDKDFVFPITFDTLVMFLDELIKFLELIDADNKKNNKEKEYFDFVLFLKKIFNFVIHKDYLGLKVNFNSLEKDLKFFLLKFNSKKDMLVFLNILSLFFNLFRDKFDSNLDNLFAESD
jgi:hypothetical protein